MEKIICQGGFMKKSTKELLELLKNTKDYKDFSKENYNDLIKADLPSELNKILIEKNLKKSLVIEKSNLDKTYAYQIFSGVKKPSRDKLLQLCFGMDLSLDEVQKLLKTTSYALLYAKDKRDSVIIFALSKNLSVIETNELLYELNYELFE